MCIIIIILGQICVSYIANTSRTHAHTHSRAHTRAHTCAHTCTCVHTCTHVYTRVHTCTHVHTRAHMCTHVHTHAHTCTHVYTRAHTCTHVHTCAHTCTHVHTRAHTCTHTVVAAVTVRRTGYRYSVAPSTHELATRFTRGFGSFSRIKQLLCRTDTRTRDRMHCQTIRIVIDISRDDRARIATCSLRTLTDRLKENYSIDDCLAAVLVSYTHPIPKP